MNLEHDRCSELLGPLLRGELSEQEAMSVEEHLADCEECRAERLGLEALIDAPAVMKLSAEPLTELERARLHRAIADALPKSRTIVSEPSKPWTARIAPYLGTAAVLVLILFGVTQINLGGGDDEAASGDSGAITKQTSEEGTGADDAAGGGGAELDAAEAPAPDPSFEADAGEIDPEAARHEAATAEPYVSFASSFVTQDAEDLDERYLRTLADASEPEGDPETIQECGHQVLAEESNHALPAYAGYGSVANIDVLILGFVYNEEVSGPLDKFMLWIWPRDDCSVPTSYTRGIVKP